jgi:hypothetical protein
VIERKRLKAQIDTALRRSRVVALIGPRQCGKTTLAREYVASNSINYFDLESPRSAARLEEPLSALENLTGLVVIDEVQRQPDLFPILRVLADRDPLPAHFLVLGSATLNWLQQSSESLAGRIEVIEMGGFSLEEVGAAAQTVHWLRGGLPLSFLAQSDDDSFVWRESFMQAVVERDLPILGVGTPAPTLRRFWGMLAHYHAQIWNASAVATAMQISQPTARRYLDVLEGVHMIRQLQPWHENLSKRQIKSPKIYVRDSGIAHALLNIRTRYDLEHHPVVGASWEGYALEEVIRALRLRDVYFWATSNGAELDLFALKDGKRLGFEFKRVDAPRMTPSMRTALADLKLDSLQVIYPGDLRYTMGERVEAVPLRNL